MNCFVAALAHSRVTDPVADRHLCGDDLCLCLYLDLCFAFSPDLHLATSSDGGSGLVIGRALDSGDHPSSSGRDHLDGGHRSRGCLCGDVSGYQCEPW